MEEKSFSVKIYFNKQESNMFGLTNSSTVLVIPESVKDQILEEFKNQNSILTIGYSDNVGVGVATLIRYVNCRNILYIDVAENVVPKQTDGTSKTQN